MTRRKQRLLAPLPNISAQDQGRDVLVAYNEDLSDTLAKACVIDSDLDAVHLVRAAHIFRRHIIGVAKKDSVPLLLLGFCHYDLGRSRNQAPE